MRLAVETGKTLTEFLRGTTHRQMRVWRRWLQDEWNRPSRSDYYLMQVVHAIRQSKARSLEKFKVPFSFRKSRGRRYPDTRELAVAMVGGSAERITITRTEAARIEAMSVGDAANERRRLAKEAAAKREAEGGE